MALVRGSPFTGIQMTPRVIVAIGSRIKTPDHALPFGTGAVES
jgi:hypothetical protein